MDALMNRKPVELLEDRVDVLPGASVSEEMGIRVLDGIGIFVDEWKEDQREYYCSNQVWK